MSYQLELIKVQLPMGPSVSFPLPFRIAQKLPVRNSWELIVKQLPIPLPIFYFEFIREVCFVSVSTLKYKQFGNCFYFICNAIWTNGTVCPVCPPEALLPKKPAWEISHLSCLTNCCGGSEYPSQETHEVCKRGWREGLGDRQGQNCTQKCVCLNNMSANHSKSQQISPL